MHIQFFHRGAQNFGHLCSYHVNEGREQCLIRQFGEQPLNVICVGFFALRFTAKFRKITEAWASSSRQETRERAPIEFHHTKPRPVGKDHRFELVKRSDRIQRSPPHAVLKCVLEFLVACQKANVVNRSPAHTSSRVAGTPTTDRQRLKRRIRGYIAALSGITEQGCRRRKKNKKIK